MNMGSFQLLTTSNDTLTYMHTFFSRPCCCVVWHGGIDGNVFLLLQTNKLIIQHWWHKEKGKRLDCQTGISESLWKQLVPTKGPKLNSCNYGRSGVIIMRIAIMHMSKYEDLSFVQRCFLLQTKWNWQIIS